MYHKKLVEAEKNLGSSKESRLIDLSNEKFLSLQDYSFLSSILRRTIFLETLILPKFEHVNQEEVLALINDATVFNTSITKIQFHESIFECDATSAILPHFKQIQSRLERNKQRIFGIHGGGNIGLGLMADIVSRSSFAYRIIGTSSDSFTNNLINCTKRLWLKHSASGAIPSTCIRRVSMLDARSQENIVNLYTESNLAALSLTEAGFLNVRQTIARGLISRYEKDAAGLKILVLMNKPNGDSFVKNIIKKEINSLVDNSSLAQKVLSSVQFIPTMVDRISSKISKDNVLMQLKKQLLDLPIDRHLESNFVSPKKMMKGQINHILTNPSELNKALKTFNLRFDLFNAEQKFNLFVPQSFTEAHRFPAMKMTKNIHLLMQIKNKYLNGPHAILAWMGALMGYSTISEAIKNPTLLKFIKTLMDHEVAPILRTEFPEISGNELASLRNSFLERCETNSDDPIKRVGRDPLRKLNIGACVRGILDLHQKHKLKFATPRLELGMAAAVLYAIKNIDSTNSECQKIQEIFIRNGSYYSILSYKGPSGSSANYFGLDKIKDRNLLNNILIRISFLHRVCNLKKEQRLMFIDALLFARSYKDFSKRTKNLSKLQPFIPSLFGLRTLTATENLQGSYRFSHLSPNYITFKHKSLRAHLNSDINTLKDVCTNFDFPQIKIRRGGMVAKIHQIHIDAEVMK